MSAGDVVRLLGLLVVLFGYFYLCRATATVAAEAGRDPAMWLIYAVFVPGISYAHARILRTKSSTSRDDS
jgi:hypothetical protein